MGTGVSLVSDTTRLAVVNAIVLVRAGSTASESNSERLADVALNLNDAPLGWSRC